MTAPADVNTLARKFENLAADLDDLSTRDFRYGGALAADVANLRRVLADARRAVEQMKRNAID